MSPFALLLLLGAAFAVLFGIRWLVADREPDCDCDLYEPDPADGGGW